MKIKILPIGSLCLASLLAVGALCGVPRAAEAKDVSTVTATPMVDRWQDVPYGTSAKQKMDIYLPPKGEGPFPVILILHGHGVGKRSKEMTWAMTGLERGYAVVCADYREPPEARFPEDVADAKAVVRFIKANAAQYQLDGSRIAVWGESMGGRLAAFLGVAADHPELDEPAGNSSGVSSRVNAVIAWFPILDDLGADAELRNLGLKPTVSHLDSGYGFKMYGASLTDIGNLAGLANPARYVGADASPFLIMHGAKDCVSPVTQSENFAAILKKNIGGSRVSFVRLDNAGHHVADFTGKNNLNKVFKFLHKHLKIKAMQRERAQAKKKK